MKNLINPLCLAMGLGFLSQNVMAVELGDAVQLHGFISQSAVLSPDNPYAGKASEDGSFAFRELGVNLSWQIQENLRFSGQLLGRQQGESDSGDLRADYLLMDYLAHETMDSHFGVRLGRVKTPFGLYNQSRDIPSARPGVDVPPSIYFDSLRDAVISLDGLNLYGSILSDSGVFNWQLYSGYSELDSAVMEKYLYPQEIIGRFRDAALNGLYLEFQPENLSGLSLGFSALTVSTRLQATQSVTQAGMRLQNSDALQSASTVAATPVELGGLGLTPGSDAFNAYLFQASQQEAEGNYVDYLTGTEFDALFALWSMQYAVDDWVFSAEYLNIFTDLDFEVLGENTNVDTTSEAYFLQAEWFFKPGWSLLTRYETLDYVVGSEVRIGEDRLNDPFRESATAWTFGLGWDINRHWAIKAQASVNEGTAWMPLYEGSENDYKREHWNLYQLQVSYQF